MDDKYSVCGGWPDKIVVVRNKAQRVVLDSGPCSHLAYIWSKKSIIENNNNRNKCLKGLSEYILFP